MKYAPSQLLDSVRAFEVFFIQHNRVFDFDGVGIFGLKSRNRQYRLRC